MYFNILLSIVFASGLFFILKLFKKTGVDNFHGIVINYFVAALCSWFADYNTNLANLGSLKSFLPLSFVIGSLFILVFLFTAKVTQKTGIGVASVAAKLSMVIPIAAGIILYREGIQFIKIFGVLLALVAVFIINWPEKDQRQSNSHSFLMPFILFLGCGVVDTSIKFAQHYFMSDANRQLMIMSMFASAGIIGAFRLFYLLFKENKRVSMRSFSGGVILGIINYFSLFFLIRSFEAQGAESSKVFAMVNLGVVILSSVLALVIFKEKLNRNKLAGMTIALVAIFALYFV